MGPRGILLVLLLISIVVIVGHLLATATSTAKIEGFASGMGPIAGITPLELSTVALDAVPSTSEVKQHYKTLLLFADSDIRKQGIQGLRILADFRDRVFGPRDFRTDLTEDDFLSDLPAWLPPMNPAVQEPVPDSTAAVSAESKILAYLQKNWPAEDNVDAQTGSIVNGIIEDFGYRFLFERGKEVAQVRPDFLRQPLLKNWVNPIYARKAAS